MKQKKSFYLLTNYISNRLLYMLVFLAILSAQIGAGTVSSWGNYQPMLPKELSR